MSIYDLSVEYDDEVIRGIIDETIDELAAEPTTDELADMVIVLSDNGHNYEHLEYWNNDEEFFSTYFEDNYSAVRAALFGDYNFSDNYVQFDGYANLKSFDSVDSLYNGYQQEIVREYLTLAIDDEGLEVPAGIENIIERKTDKIEGGNEDVEEL